MHLYSLRLKEDSEEIEDEIEVRKWRVSAEYVRT